MAYDSTNKTLYTSGSRGISTSEIAACLGDNRVTSKGRDIGLLCTSPKIKGFARYKPIARQTRSSVTIDDHAAANFGWNIPSPFLVSLRNSNSMWSRVLPLQGYYRMLDFNGYYHDAPNEVLSQCVGNKMTFNVMNPFPGIIAFYFFNRRGQLADRMKYDTGMTLSKYGRTSFQLDRCVGLEDLKTENGYSLYKGGAQLGVVFWDKGASSLDSPIAESWCDELFLPTGSTYDETYLAQMYRKELIDVVLPSGEYNAVFCLRIPTDELGDGDGALNPILPTGKTYRYVRVQDVSGYPSIVSAAVGGAEKMEYTIQGLATSATSASWVTTLNTKASVAYVKATVTNKSGITITNTDAFQQRWNAKIRTSGNKVISGSSSATSINHETTPKIYRWRYFGESSWKDGSTSYISLDNNRSVEIIYQINDIWDLGELMSPLSSARVTVGVTPRFDEDPFTYGGTQVQTLTINYS